MSAFLKIEDPGLYTTLQDCGRFGYQRYGVPVSGALDHDSLAIANALVGAKPDAAALEFRFLGPTFEVEADSVRIALSGAEFNGEVIRGEERFAINAGRSETLSRGDRVKIGPLRASSTGYLAVAGGFAAERVLDSLSTFAKSGFGGLEGRPLKADDRVPLNSGNAPSGSELTLAKPFDLSPPRTIRVVPGPQADYFTDEARKLFVETDWKITKNADRMGLRFEGPTLDHARGYNITSDGMVTGGIQVPGAGLPILLLADRQTSGGYPKIATAITADLPALGRKSPGDTVRFSEVSAAEGAEIARAHAAWLKRILEAIKPYHPKGPIDLDALYGGNLISAPIMEE